MIAALAAAVLAVSSPAAPPRSAEILHDLMGLFGGAARTGTTASEVRRWAPSGGDHRPAIFEHPAGLAAPARITYRLRLPAVRPGDQIVFITRTALSDGITWGGPEPPDGVRFAVGANGVERAARIATRSRWEPFAVDLTDLAGQEFRLYLEVGARGNLRYDWALWEQPRVVRVPAARGPAPLTGVALVRLRAGQAARITVNPGGGGRAVEWSGPAAPSRSERIALDYSFPYASGVSVLVDPPGAAVSIQAAAYPCSPGPLLVGAATRAPVAKTPTGIVCEVGWAGPGSHPGGGASVRFTVDGRPIGDRPVPALAPDERIRLTVPWTPGTPGLHRVTAEVRGSPRDRWSATQTVEVFPARRAGDAVIAQSPDTRIEFVKVNGAFAYARVIGRRSGRWEQAAVWRPLMRAIVTSPRSDHDIELRPRRCRPGRAGELVFDEVGAAAGAGRLSARMTVGLSGRRGADVTCSWCGPTPPSLRALYGPDLNVGDPIWGDRKVWAIVPGVEYLYRGEPSSSPRDLLPPLNDRRTPDPFALTRAAAAVSVGPAGEAPPVHRDRFYCADSMKDRPSPPVGDEDCLTVALLWNPARSRADAGRVPALAFSSPNRDTAAAGHRMALFLPGVPVTPLNMDRARRPFAIAPGRPAEIRARLFVGEGPALVALRDPGAPGRTAPTAPRSLRDEIDLCIDGLTGPCWDTATSAWRACLGRPPEPSPGLTALTWLAARTDASPDRRARAREVADQALAALNVQNAPGALVNPSGVHILRWELPFLTGRLAESLSAMEGMAHGAMGDQRADGGWRWATNDPERSGLGAAGDGVLGSSAYLAFIVNRAARIGGAPDIVAAGARALEFMERFRVPRGAGMWECPMYEPDLLASAMAVGAYVEGYRTSGNPRWLHDALYWAESGLVFTYGWGLPDRPMMVGSTTSNVGSTFFTHSWIGVPVQWVGLVYAYQVQQLADLLDGSRPAPGRSPLPLSAPMNAAELRAIASAITLSGMQQQCGPGPRAGCYPDSISDFIRPNEPYINPEDILLNRLKMDGIDLNIHTVRPETGLVISSGAQISRATSSPARVSFALAFWPGDNCHALVAGADPKRVRVDGAPLPEHDRREDPSPGWWRDPLSGRIFLILANPTGEVSVEIDR